MKDFKDNEDRITNSEDNVSAAKADKNVKHHRPVDDGFKTSDKDYKKQEWTEPLDEQQFDDKDLSEGAE